MQGSILHHILKLFRHYYVQNIKAIPVAYAVHSDSSNIVAIDHTGLLRFGIRHN
jgi:hypothetical protein